MKAKTDNDTQQAEMPASNESQQAPVNNRDDFWGPVIHTYSRAQAIEDGVLIDVSQMAREAGFRYPVAITTAAWQEAVAVSTTDHVPDETGRLWHVLNVLRFVIESSPGGSELSLFLTICDENEEMRKVHLKSVCGPGDDAEPVITIMLPNED